MDDMITLSKTLISDRTIPRKLNVSSYGNIICQICNMSWALTGDSELLAIACAYHHFSIQFRENLEIACQLYPDNESLKAPAAEECHTDNLSPWPDVAEIGEKLDHDEFMRRSLSLQPVDRADPLRRVGASYLETVRRVDPLARAKSIASYEDGGLSRVFPAMLRAPCWDGAALRAFRFFLEQYIPFDWANDQGHGALCRQLVPDEPILPLWAALRDLLAIAVPRFTEPRSAHGRMSPISTAAVAPGCGVATG